jgi:arylsulfatase
VVCGFEDWIPTLIELTGSGAAVPDHLDGVSLAGILTGRTDDLNRPFLYREFQGYGGQQAVWLGPWKGVRKNILRRNNPDPLDVELYRLDTDPGETDDLAAAFPEIRDRIVEIMKSEHTPSALFPMGPLD